MDVALGTCAMLFAGAQVISTPIPWYFYLLLFQGTLVVYWFDHILDSRKPLLVQTGSRHSVFKEKRVLFYILISLLVLSNAFVALYFLSLLELVYGLILFFALLIYLFLHRKFIRIFILEKELLIAILYTSSLVFPLFAIVEPSLFSYNTLSIFLIGSMVFFAVLQNLFSIAKMESESDEEMEIRNITQSFGSYKLRQLQVAMLALQFFLGLVLWVIFPNTVTLKFVGISLLISFGQFFLPNAFQEANNDSYRIVGELLYLLGFFV
ncbi:MAG: hypothetical protein K9J84_08095 [Bacteroidia bacterium]|nr:hypothetical protein [Bacteroidia bacterium]